MAVPQKIAKKERSEVQVTSVVVKVKIPREEVGDEMKVKRQGKAKGGAAAAA